MLTANRKTEDCAFLALLIGVTALFLWMMLPFFDVIFWAATIGILFHPVYRTIAEKWRMGRILSAFITILLCLVLIIIPLSYILYNCVVEATLLYQRLHSDQNSFVGYIDRIKDSYPFLQDWLHYAGYDLERIKSLLTKAALSASSFLARNTVTLGENTLGFLTNLALVLYIAFFLLMDGTKIQELLIKALPFGDHREKLLFRKFAEVTRATVKGSLLVAAAQGALGGVIFWLLDIHAALLWGVVMTALALIPVVGAALVWGPVAVYLLLTGDYWDGGILLAYGSTVIGLADNLLRPLLVGRDTKLPDFLVLLSTLGGFVFFGMDGFVRPHARRAVRDRLADFHCGVRGKRAGFRSFRYTRRYPVRPQPDSSVPTKAKKSKARANPEGNGNPFENRKVRPPDSGPLQYTLTPDSS
ncbi:MAG: AI-2E family transporter [Bilophila wadsworthia]